MDSERVHEDPEDPDNSDVDDWDIRVAFNDLIIKRNGLQGWSKTLPRIIYTTFGILNNMLWDGMDNIPEKNYKIIDVIKNIAYINIKKEPGRSTANPDELKKIYYRDEAVILHQIGKFDPDIIICGGTLETYLINGLGLKEENSVQLSGLKCYLQNDKIYIRAYHPSYWAKKECIYCDEIINAVRAWEEMKSK